MSSWFYLKAVGVTLQPPRYERKCTLLTLPLWSFFGRLTVRLQHELTQHRLDGAGLFNELRL